jgi:hypothetical protein
MKKQKKPLVVLAGFLAACSASAPSDRPAEGPSGSTHADLVGLHEEFRALRVPEIRDGVPDYTAAAMDEKHKGLRGLMARLTVIDTTGWSIAERVDYMVVFAEMNAMDFDHRVLRPWSSDPAFYVVVNFQFGPKMYGASRLPSLPLSPDRIEDTRTRLRAISGILEQARGNLTEPKPDQTMLGIRTKDREAALLSDFLAELPSHHPDLVADANASLAAVREFQSWLESIEADLVGPSGLGPEQYTWFMHKVMLLPYSWEEAVTITERDLPTAVQPDRFTERIRRSAHLRAADAHRVRRARGDHDDPGLHRGQSSRRRRSADRRPRLLSERERPRPDRAHAARLLRPYPGRTAAGTR